MIEDATTHLLSAEVHPTLPPLPEDDKGRYTRWMLATDTTDGGFWVWSPRQRDYIEVEVDEAKIDRWVSEYERMCDRGYHAPLQSEHSGANTNGERLGDVLTLTKWTKPNGELALIAAVAFVDPHAKLRVQRGAIRFCSPGIGSRTDERGRRFEDVFLELSLTTQPQQIGKGATHVLSANNTGDAVEEKDTTTEAPDPGDEMAEMKKAMGAIMKKLNALEERFNAMSQGEEPDAEAMGEPAEEASAEVQLSAELAQVKRELEKTRFVAALGGDVQITLSAATAEALFEIAGDKPQALAAFIQQAKAKAPAPKPPPATTEPPAGPVQWSQILGADTTPPVAETLTPEEIGNRARALVAEKGGSYTEHFVALSALHGQEV